jgi:ABC-2 type transport system permease protein
MKLHRIKAVLLRHVLDTKHNWFRIIDIVFWPMVDLLLWGFLTLFLVKTNTALSSISSMILGAIILWSLYFRLEQEMAFCFMSEVWEKNVLNLFASPLTFAEYFCGITILALGKTIITLLGLTTIAYLFYSYDLFSTGWALSLLLFNLIVHGFILGLFSISIILRYGTKAEYVAWWLPFLVQPFSVVTIPLRLLPGWMQTVSYFLPTSHIFEGLRSIVIENKLPLESVMWASGLNIVYFVIAALTFRYTFNTVREKGFLAKL